MSLNEFLQSQSVPYESFLHSPAPSATRFAGCVHVTGHRVAKGVLARSESRYLLAVLPATARIDWARLSEALGGAPVTLATEDEVCRVFGDCELGALPPFGGLYGIPTVVESSLAADGAEIVFVGSRRHEGLRMRYLDYETLARPVLARFATMSRAG